MDEMIEIVFCFYGDRKYRKSIFNRKYEQFFYTSCTINDIHKILEFIKLCNSLNINENEFDHIIIESIEQRLKYSINENNEIIILDLSHYSNIIDDFDIPSPKEIRRQTNWNPTLVFEDVETFILETGFCTEENIYYIKNRNYDKYRILWLASNNTNNKNILYRISSDVIRICTEFI